MNLHLTLPCNKCFNTIISENKLREGPLATNHLVTIVVRTMKNN